MLIRAGFNISYECPRPTPMLLMLDVHPDRVPDIRGQHGTSFDRSVDVQRYTDGFGNACMRVVLPEGVTAMTADFVIADSGRPDDVAPLAGQHPVEALPSEVLVFLLGSRYCDTDRLSETAWALFGDTPTGWERVQAICDYTHDRLTFGYDYADPTRTAWTAHQQRHGVCRDYVHLAVTLCRCMNIPARYCTGYLGDIGVPASDEPMDFSAWFEAFLDGRWYIFDPRQNAPRIGRILMARGRDATDVALCTTFGPCTLVDFQVRTSALPNDGQTTAENPHGPFPYLLL
jgi:transglutaminase-like putative cysteine protease